LLDLTGIMFSTIMMLYIVLKAVQLDRALPWFQVPGRQPHRVKDLAPVRPAEPSWRTRTNAPPAGPGHRR
jgi:hypothetical protein